LVNCSGISEAGNISTVLSGDAGDINGHPSNEGRVKSIYE